MEQGQAAAMRKKDLSGYAALIVAVTGLITVFVHKPPEDAAKAGYIELTTALLASQAAEKQNHDDIVALRSYIEDYTKGHTVVQTPMPTAGEVTPPSAWTPPTNRTPVPTVVHVSAPASAVPPPPIPPQAVPKRIKEAKDIAW